MVRLGTAQEGKGTPSKRQETAHSALTIVLRMALSGPMARNARTDPADENAVNVFAKDPEVGVEPTNSSQII